MQCFILVLGILELLLEIMAGSSSEWGIIISALIVLIYEIISLILVKKKFKKIKNVLKACDFILSIAI